MRADIFKLKKAVTKLCLATALILSAVTISNIVSPEMTAYAAEDGEITISDTITGVISDGGTVITISGTGKIPQLSSYVTGYTTIETVIIEEGITSLDNKAFKGWTGLSNISLPNGLTTMGYYIFDGCTNLTEITIPKTFTTPTSSLNGSLENSSITTITFEEGMIKIPNNMCYGCAKLTIINFPESVTTIGEKAFWKCTSLTSIELTSNVTTINGNAFYGCTSLAEITIPDSVTYIGNYAFKVDAETPITVHTSNSYVMGINWLSKYNRIVTFIDASAFQEGITMTGTVSPITTIDITIPLDAFQFRIDEERNLEVQTTEITNNSQYPLEMYILNIEATNEAPDVVAKDTFTDKEWNNLTATQTMNNIAISLNEYELYTVFNNTELDKALAIKIGNIKSGFVESQILEITPDVQYGKSFLNTEDITLQYKVVFEVVIP